MDHGVVRRHPRLLIAAALLAAAFLAGCGGSGSPFGGSPHPPAGFITYRGDGFRVSVPAGYRARAASVGGVPAGSTVTSFTHGGASPQQTNAEVLVLRNPHLTSTLGQVVGNLEREDVSNPEISHPLFGSTSATVPGARSARIVSERYTAAESSSDPASVTFERKWLMMQVKPGLLLDVIVVSAPKLASHLDPDAVLDSVRLEQ
jgi:hypothetical protein